MSMLFFSERIQSADSIANGLDTEVENVFPEQAAQDRLDDLPQCRPRCQLVHREVDVVERDP